jgi:hypothetical protein
MSVNRVTASVLGVVAVVGLGIWLAVEHQARLRLVEEHKALEQQVDQMTSLIARNEQLSILVAQANPPQSLSDDQSRELLRLRGEVGVLRQQARELETVRNENRQAHAPERSAAEAAATADYWPRDSWTFSGYASPDAALQTSLWAANNGDLKALLGSATGDLRKLMEADLQGKSENEASIRAMDEVIAFKSIRVLNRELQGEDTAVITAAIEDRTETHTVKLLMRKVDNDWKVSGPAQ